MPKGGRGGKSGLHGQTVPDNVRRGLKALGTVPQRRDRGVEERLAAVRVKRGGKSAPRFQRWKRHGKPHREQDRVGMTRSEGFGLSGPVIRGGCLMRRATVVQE